MSNEKNNQPTTDNAAIGIVVKREYMVSGYLDDLPCQVTIEAASREDAIIQAKSDYEDFYIIGASEV